MVYLGIGFLLAGACLLVLGYRRNDRHLLLVAALLLFAAGTAGDFLQGVTEGVRDWAG